MAVVGAFDALEMIRRLPLDEKQIKEVEDLVKSFVDDLGKNHGIDKNFEIEDVLESFVVGVAVMLRKKETRWFIKSFIIRNFFPHGFVLKDIKKRLLKLDDKICKGSLISRIQNICSQRRVISQGLPRLMPTTYTHGIEEHFVGMDDELEKLVSLVVGRENRVISIWGVTGLGKTTMARRIYNHQEVRKSFDAFVWVFYSQGRDINIVLLNILNQLSGLPIHFPNETLPTTEIMIDKLKTALGKRDCLIVLDNIQDMDQWNQLTPAFITKKSVILLTTCEESIATNTGSPHKLRHLDDDEGWNLLKKHAFKKNDCRDVGLFRRVGREMVEKCEYLPSAISRLGTVLSKKTYWCDWQMVGYNVSEHIKDHKIEGDEKLSKDLDYRYAGLPFYLKQCFLYLGHFSKDEEIDVEDLSFLWIAEGMVTSKNEVKKKTTLGLANENREETTLGLANEDREVTAQDIANEDRADIANEDRDRITPDVADEEIADDMVVSSVSEVVTQDIANEDSGEVAIDRAKTYITELASRKVVQVVATRRLGSCFLRSQARELSSWEEGFRLQIIDFSNAAQSAVAYISFDSRARRLAIDFNQLAAFIILELLEDSLRSLFLFNSGKKSFEKWLTFLNFGQFTLLRVLNFVRCKFDGRKLPEGIDKLLNLRYLGLLYCDLAELPLSIGNLINLRVLNVRVFENSHILVPNDFLHKLVLLSHLRLPYHAYREETKKLILDNLLELETLFGFNSLIHADRALSKLPKLRRLRAHVYNNDRLKKLLDFIESDNKSIRTDLIIENKCDLSSKEGEPLLVELLMFSKLHALTLSSVLISKIPNYELDSSSKLTHLKLIGCRIQEDPMKVLGKFPNLQKLCLGYGAYVGSEMNVYADDDFPKLAYLEIHSLRCFEKLTIAEGAMRNLSDVIIRRCPKLKMIPGGLESISNLKYLEIELAAEAFVHVSEEEYCQKFLYVPSRAIRRCIVPLKDQ